MPLPADPITEALRELNAHGSSPEATQRVWDLIYPDLHAIASRLMRGESEGHTLQPTALVNEAYVRLVDQSRTEWGERAHFLAVAARVMRRILLDHARRKSTDKRGGSWRRVTLQTQIPDERESDTFELLALDRALDALQEQDSRVASVVELRVFSGMTMREIAAVLQVSKRTVDSDWSHALRWLAVHLEHEGDAS